jgi:glutamate/aspartate transport system substrate-binding protein
MRATLVVLLFTSLFASPLAAQQFEGTLQQIKDSGEIRIGFRESEPPMSFVGGNGVPMGYSIDICNLIVAALNDKIGAQVKVTYVPVTADDRFSALTNNKIDILCGATTNTLARREFVDFTQTTFITGASLMTLKSSNLEDLSSLNRKKIGVVKNTTTIEVLYNMLEKSQTNARVVRVESAYDGLQMLRSGEIDAFSSDQVVLIGLAITAEDVADFAISPGVFSFEPFALAVRRNDSDFRLVADRVISHLYRTEQILPIYDKWMGKFSKKRPPVFEALFQLNATPLGQ